VGPLSVGYLNERLGATGASLGMSLAIVGGASAFISVILYALATRRVSAANSH
jgi:hypothetical protein